MRSLSSLFHAIANLAGSINALTAVIDVAAGRLRQSLALDEGAPAVIEHQSLDAETPTNGRRRAKAAV